MELIRCPKCKKFFKRNDLVVIDLINAITHVECVSGSLNDIPAKHSGPFHYIKKKYPYFGE